MQINTYEPSYSTGYIFFHFAVHVLKHNTLISTKKTGKTIETPYRF